MVDSIKKIKVLTYWMLSSENSHFSSLSSQSDTKTIHWVFLIEIFLNEGFMLLKDSRFCTSVYLKYESLPSEIDKTDCFDKIIRFYNSNLKISSFDFYFIFIKVLLEKHISVKSKLQ